MKRIILFSIAALLVSSAAFAQSDRECRTPARQTKTGLEASGEYTYYAPLNITPEQAKATALERAKNQIIADHFGTVVGVNNTSLVSNVNGESNVSFLSIGESEVKGEWIETKGEPEYHISFEQNMMVVKVSVTGVIRKILSARIPFEARILRNGTDDRFESEKFRKNDYFFISFTTVEYGYLAVYQYDGNIVYRLLPQKNSHDGSFEVQGGERYVLFQQGSSASKSIYKLTCEQENELNRIYIIFSPNKFSRAVDSVPEDKELTASLSFEEFQHWLSKCRKQDTEMGVLQKDILITK